MLQAKKERIILGIDPGTTVMGYGIIKEVGKEISLISLGVIKLAHLSNQALKLQQIFKQTEALIKAYHPDFMACEAPFFGKNVQVMLKLGRAQGVAMAAALAHDVPIVEYAPRKIKQSVTGNGNATKEQVSAMLKTLLKFDETPQFLDATDGLAAAVCHSFQGSALTGDATSYSGWEAFAKNNANRLK